MSICQSCKAEVVFVPSAKSGRPMILDARPTKGVVLVTLRPDDEWGFVASSEVVSLHGVSVLAVKGRHTNADLPLPDYQAVVVDVYTDHHVTCPNASDWQGRTRKSPPVRSIAPGLADVDGGRRGD